MIVVDTNVIAHLLLPGEETETSEKLLRREPHWIAPQLWRSEFRNVLVLFMKRGRIDLDDARALAGLAEGLMRGREFRVASDEVLKLADSSGCSAYDCEFAALARIEGVLLATTDNEMLRAFSFARRPAELH